MIKHLIFYWYIPQDGTWHEIYDLHIRNLTYFRAVFDKVTFVLSHNECNKTDIDTLVQKIRSIFGDKVIFTEAINDIEVRESKFFYEEIVQKLNSFPDNEIIFFAHNKGTYSNYVSLKDLHYWINIMYFSNLSNMQEIEKFFLQRGCAIGDIKIENYRSNDLWFLTHNWHFSGTFFWIYPKEMNLYLQSNSVNLLEGYGRYYSEGFLGKIFPSNSKKIKSIHRPKDISESLSHFWESSFNDEEKYVYNILYS